MSTQIKADRERDEQGMLPGFVPWPASFARTYRGKGYWEGFGIGDVFERLATLHPERPAIVDGATRLSVGELWQQSGWLAAQFAQMGLKPRDRVIFQLPNSNEFILSFLALMRIGVIPVMALPAHRRTEIVHFVRATQAVGVFIPGSQRDFDHRIMAQEIQSDEPTLRHVFVLGEPLPGQVSIPTCSPGPLPRGRWKTSSRR